LAFGGAIKRRDHHINATQGPSRHRDFNANMAKSRRYYRFTPEVQRQKDR
jgi:hypothetical protein